MKKQILDRGYVTNALTTGGDILGLIKDSGINFNSCEKEKTYYWSEVYCEPGVMAMIIRQGTLLVDPTPEQLSSYFEQSKVNLH